MYFTIDQYFPHSAVITGISVDVSIDAVETIFDEALRANPMRNLGPNKKKDTIGGGGANIPGINENLLDEQHVEDDATFAIVKPELEKIVQGALQFYDDFSTLQAIHDYVETLPIMKMGNFLRQPMPARRIIVKKLINASDYETYTQSIISNKTDVNRVNFYVALKTKLDNL